MEEILTIGNLRTYLGRIMEAEGTDLPIEGASGPLHIDDLEYRPGESVLLRGNIYRTDEAMRAQELRIKINKALEEYSIG